MATLELKSGIDIKDFRANYLLGLPSSLRKPEDWSENYLLRKMRAAEDELERSLSCYYTPKRIVCEPAPPLVLGKDYDIVEPAYDYSSQFYVGENWGGIRLRHYPVHADPLPTVKFAYPNIDHRIFTVPPAWIRLYGPFGMIRLVPDSISIVASFSAFILSVLSGGQGVPQSIFVTYTAGFDGVNEKEDLETDHNDLLELTKRLAVLNIISDAFMATSTSNSADGLSQSNSYPQLKDMRAAYDKDFGRFQSKIKGIRLAVL